MTALRNQFICGLKDHGTRVELFKKSELTFDTAYKEAIAVEKALKNADGSHTVLDKSVLQQRTIYALNSTSQGHGDKSHKQSSQQQSQSRNRNENKLKQRAPGCKANYVCYYCGKPNHLAKVCRHPFETCNHCKRKRHLEQACRTKNSEQQQVKFLEMPTTQAETTPINRDSVSGLYNKYEFFSLNVNYADHQNETCARFDKVFCNANKVKADPMYINIIINSNEMVMEIDTGVYATISSEKVKNESFKELELLTTRHFLEDYVENVLNPVG